jgi:hypothetical protein
MSTLLKTPVVGLEDIQRAAFYVFFEHFNAVLSEVEAYWDSRDQIFDQRTGRSTYPTTLEPIAADNFHEGHKPSLILNNPDGYPNLAVFANTAAPSSEDTQLDQIDSWLDMMVVEIMVKADDEDSVNRRIQRTSEAAVICLRRNPTLGGAIDGLESSPTLAISDVAAVRTNAQGTSSGDYGPRFLWQGSQIQWRVRKDSLAPGNLGSIFAGASQTDYSQYIDQG